MGTLDYLGCSGDAFRHHLENKFEIGMSWENYGEWEIDHIVPIKYPGAEGGPPTLAEAEARLHYLNTQPLWRDENRRKKNLFVGRPPPFERKDQKLTESDIDEILADLVISRSANVL